MERIWDKYLIELDKKVYEIGGFGKRIGFGKKAAILVIDVQYRTCGDRPAPILESMQTYKTSCGERGWAAVSKIRKLLELARSKKIPVIYPTVERKEEIDLGHWKEKTPTMMDKSSFIGDRGPMIIEEIAPQKGDIVISKRFASAFFGTSLLSYLIQLGIDTLLVTGATTSGCVRATVSDAFSYGFRVVVVEDCVFDRGEVSHAVNLFDMNSKYADVLPLEAVLDYLQKVEDQP
jgi:nicotinamidase-related amidase